MRKTGVDTGHDPLEQVRNLPGASSIEETPRLAPNRTGRGAATGNRLASVIPVR